jgi:hypothetical protein
VVPLAPWEKVYIKLVGTQTGFSDIDPTHATIGCTGCHGGEQHVESASTTLEDRIIAMEEAHTDMQRDPSMDAEGKCGICHEDIVARNEHSTHSMLWGERYKVAFRYDGSESLDDCPAEINAKFDGECMSCHTTCGQCHVSRPNSVHGGFIAKHKFNKTPDMTNNCTACHGSRIGTDFTGSLEGNVNDTHYQRGYDCLDCHTEDMHGDGTELNNPPISRYAVNGLPTCEGCHTDVASSNTYHNAHWTGSGFGDDLSCFVCHSQPYNNCNSCHVAGEWKGNYGEVGGETDIHSGDGNYLEYPGFRIGHNPAYNDENGPWSPSLKLHANDEWILVRHIPVVDDTYENWNAENHTIDINTMETWQYTSPHNVIRWTTQTDTTGGIGCSVNCHSEDLTQNLDLYLTQTFVDSTTNDVDANLNVIVDDHLE